VQITYDPGAVSYEELLNVFFEEHNPTGRPVRVSFTLIREAATLLPICLWRALTTWRTAA